MDVDDIVRSLRNSPRRGGLTENSPLIKKIRAASPKLAAIDANIEKKSTSSIRWLVLVCGCSIAFSNYYNYDIPAALITNIKRDLMISDIQYNMLYSVYSLPNVLLPLAGGILLDRIGINKSFLMFVSAMLVGQFTVAVGMYSDSYTCMLVGRFIYGVGAESTTVANNSLMIEWFKNKEMGMAMGLATAIGRLGSVVNYQVSPVLGKSDLSLAFFGGVGLCCVQLLSVVLVIYLDNRWQSQQKGLVQIKSSNDDAINFARLIDFQPIFWYLVASCVLCYGCMFPFMNVASDFFQTKWGVSLPIANDYLSIPFSMASIGIPLFGILVDKYGFREWFILSATLGFTFSHTCMGFTMMSPVPSLVVMGLCYCMYCGAMWPSAALLVDPNDQIGTGLGLITAIQNCGLTIFPLMVGYLKQQYSYKAVEVLFILLGLIGIIFAILIIIQDNKTMNRLNCPTLLAQVINDLRHTPEFRAIAASRSGTPLRTPSYRSL